MAPTSLCFLCFLWLLLVLFPLAYSQSGNWKNHGGDLQNRRYADGETKISVETVANLRLKWKFVAGKDISATPAIYNNTIYFPSWNGKLYALRAMDGSVIWQKDLGQLTGLKSTGLVEGVNWTVSRATPTVVDDLLIVGIYGPAFVIGLKRSNGELLWSTQIDKHYTAIITMSGTYHDSGYYVGTSSLEEYEESCCTFIGSFTKLNVKKGNVLWKTYMLPSNNGSRDEYGGAGVWGGSPSIDIQRKLVYIASGILLAAPTKIIKCKEAQKKQSLPPTKEDKCIEPGDFSSSILALDLDSGKIKWYKQLGGLNPWFFACKNHSTSGCVSRTYWETDFGEAPMILTVNVGGKNRDIVVVVQKTGIAWALDRDNGNTVWYTEAGPEGRNGGGIWGSATDGKTVFTNIGNDFGYNFTLKPSNVTTNFGGWVSMDAKSGKVLWSTGDPSNARAIGPVSLANGVLFAGSTNKKTGPIYAINAKTGKILWSYKTGATVYGGMSISNGCIYVGNGYKVNLGASRAPYSAGTTLFAFCLSK